MSRCAGEGCFRWRPGLLVRAAGLGLYLDDRWYCSAQCLGNAARERLAHVAPTTPAEGSAGGQQRLGGLLATQKRLAPELIDRAAEVQERTGLRIGTQLIELGAVTRLDVLRALASQAGVGFLTALDPARLLNAPGNLSPAVVRALRVVPFQVDTKRDVLRVACTAPVPRGSLTALRQLTGSIIEAYLVADDQWPALVEAYGASKPRASGPTTVASLDVLADRVASAARQARSVQMSEARYGNNLWVRLDAGGRVEELLYVASQAAAFDAIGARPSAAPHVALSIAADTLAASPARPARPRASKAATGSRPRRPRARAAAAPLVPAGMPIEPVSPGSVAPKSQSGASEFLQMTKRIQDERAAIEPATAPVLREVIAAPAATWAAPAASTPPPTLPIQQPPPSDAQSLAAGLPEMRQAFAREDEREELDLGFLEAWDVRAVPLFEPGSHAARQ